MTELGVYTLVGFKCVGALLFKRLARCSSSVEMQWSFVEVMHLHFPLPFPPPRGVLRWLGTARGLFGGAFTLADVILARVPRVSGGFEHCRPTLEDLFPCLTLCVLGIGVII